MSSLFDDPAKREADGQDILIAFIDGGARGNPGPAGFGCYLQDANGKCIAELNGFIGIRTNNVAEYSGLVAALKYAVEHDFNDVQVVSDSELLVKQMKGQYKVNSPDLRPLWEEARGLARRLNSFSIKHVLRGKNKEADRLANLAMDGGMKRSGASVVRANAYEKPPVNSARSSGVEGAVLTRELDGVVKDGVVEVYGTYLPEGTKVKIRVVH
ncbi:MAG: hypothetical protein NVS9B15_16750 [Acidobacteriaceae bacterium]